MSNQPDAVWTESHVRSLAPDAASVPAARKVLAQGEFGVIEPTADGRGWWVQCRGLTDSYQVTVRRDGDRFDCRCDCPSRKKPCKHALALLFHLVERPELRAEAEAPKATAGDFESLLRAVFAGPDDDTPRLVFADLLDENNQPDRATLIRLQCEQARLRANSNRYKELARLVDKLVPKVRKQTGVFPYAHRHTGMRYTFRRGFLHLEGRFEPLDLSAAPARFVNLFRDGWVEAVRPTALREYGLMNGWEPLLSHVAELDLSRVALDDNVLFATVATTSEARANGRLVRVKVHTRNQRELNHLLRADGGEPLPPAEDLSEERYFYSLTPAAINLMSRSGRLSGAYSLILEGELGDASVPALLAADRGRLAALELHGWRLSDAGTDALVGGLLSPGAALRTLTFDSCQISDAGRALAALNGPPQLESLQLVRTSFTDADAAASRGLSDLTHLNANHNHELTGAGVSALLTAPHLPKLANLELNEFLGTPHELLALLFTGPERPFLRLAFSGMTLDRWAKDGDIGAAVYCSSEPSGELFNVLTGSPELKRLTAFVGSHLGLHPAGVPAFAAAFDPANLSRLALSFEPLGNDGAAAVVAAFAGSRLRELTLSWCGLKAQGVVAVARSPLMGGVEKLDLSGNALGKSGVAALLEMDAPALRELVLGGCSVTPLEKKRLQKHFGARARL